MSENFTSKYKKPSDSPGFMLWRVTNSWQRAIREALKETGLTHTQFALLASLANLSASQPHVTQTMLAKFAHTDLMMTSQVLRSLEKKGLLTRTQHPTDSRAKCIVPNAAGVALAQRAVQLVETKDEQFFAALGDGLPDFLGGLQQLVG